MSALTVQADSYLLRLRLKLGDEFHYKTTVKVGDYPETVAEFRMKVVDVEGRCYIVKTTYSDFQPSDNPRSGPKNFASMNTLTERGQSIKLVHSKVVGASQFNMTTASGLVFPKEPVTLGATWTSTGPNGAPDPSTTYSLQKVLEVGGRRVGHFNIHRDGSTPVSEGRLKGIRSSLQLDLETGMAVAFEMTGTADAAGTPLPVRMTLVRLQKPH